MSAKRTMMGHSFTSAGLSSYDANLGLPPKSPAGRLAGCVVRRCHLAGVSCQLVPRGSKQGRRRHPSGRIVDSLAGPAVVSQRRRCIPIGAGGQQRDSPAEGPEFGGRPC